MAKRVTVQSGTMFKTLTSAKTYYNDLREAIPVGGLVSEPDKSDLVDIYHRYCVATNWPSEKAVDVTTAMDNEKRSAGSYAMTKAFAVVNESGKPIVFSIYRALEAIAV
ncbi:MULTISPECIES: hypothetical protein [unclassified Aureimonas]|uniref:hypothetical protein n=1 Tax=unclassified Aureimonas TaxID=2615206 RepID=UPI0012E3CDD4|nr:MULTISPECIES: hypothetical protein [unclassified Aureimonas]